MYGKIRSSSRLLPAHAAVLGLPGKEVQQRGQRLANKTETYPEDAVSPDFPVNTLHFLQRERDGYERELHDHPDERDS